MKTKEAPELPRPALPNFISSNLKILRHRAGWSQAELAEKVYLNRGNIASYESGTAEPSICKLLRFSNLFAVNPRDLTRRDFSQPEELALAELDHDTSSFAEQARIEQFRERARELEELVLSSQKLFSYKREKLTNPCKEAEILAAQYQQLYEVTQQLLLEHRQLLGEVACPCE